MLDKDAPLLCICFGPGGLVDDVSLLVDEFDNVCQKARQKGESRLLIWLCMRDSEDVLRNENVETNIDRRVFGVMTTRDSEATFSRTIADDDRLLFA